jgi:hypothetical protein
MRWRRIIQYLQRALRAIAAWFGQLFARPLYRAFVSFARDFFHILWICRIATASVILGFLVMWYAPQARDLFLEVAGHLGSAPQTNTWQSAWFAAIFCLSLLIFWAIPLHGAARWSLDGLARPPRTLFGRVLRHATNPRPKLHSGLVKWLPRFLGLLCFGDVGVGLGRAFVGQFDCRQIETACLASQQLHFLVAAVAIGAVIFWLYTLYRYDAINYTIRRLSNRRMSVTRASRTRDDEHPGVLLLRVLAVICVLAVSAVLFWFIVAPQNTTLEARISLVPIVLGAWVPLLSIMTWMSYPARVPILTVILLVIVIIKTIDYREHQIRTLSVDQASKPIPLELKEAITRWRQENNCENRLDDCPRPIVVAMAGGASRAAYMSASTLGLFMDLTCAQNPADTQPVRFPCGSPNIPEFAKRIFAISGVSGGSLGAAVFSAVLRSRQEGSGGPDAPCEGTSDFWFRPGKPMGWRDCMQLVLAEDFLSPAILGLAFRDQLPGLHAVKIQDRAALLEESWIAAANKYLRKPGEKDGQQKSLLAAPFHTFAPNKEFWRPLLLLNGTSVATGRRIITSHLAFEVGGKVLFNDAYDLFKLLNQRKEPKPGEVSRSDAEVSVSLATAVTNSARFPLISPEGTLLGDGKVLDRIVDGGYFENYGVITAREIAIALSQLNLRPIMLVITNDPISVSRMKQLDAELDTFPPMPAGKKNLFLAWITAPFLALYRTGSSRGDLSVIQASERFDPSDQKRTTLVQITVYGRDIRRRETPREPTDGEPRFQEVSMSWWLSKPVQEYLDRQFFDQTFSETRQQEMLCRICLNLDMPNDNNTPLAKRCIASVRDLLRVPLKTPTEVKDFEGRAPSCKLIP